MQMVCNLREFKEFIDNEMIVILGQMDSPTEIFEHVYLVRTFLVECWHVSVVYHQIHVQEESQMIKSKNTRQHISFDFFWFL